MARMYKPLCGNLVGAYLSVLSFYGASVNGFRPKRDPRKDPSGWVSVGGRSSRIRGGPCLESFKTSELATIFFHLRLEPAQEPCVSKESLP